MKNWLIIITVTVIIGITFGQYVRAREAQAIVETLEVERDSALVRVERLEDQAEEAQLVVDSLVVELVAERASSVKEIEVLEHKADSLGNALISLAEPGPAQDTTEALVEALFATHAAEVAEYRNLLHLSELTIESLMEQVRIEQEINAGLEAALEVTTRQRDAWRMAANPGFLSKLKTAAIGGGIGYLGAKVF